VREEVLHGELGAAEVVGHHGDVVDRLGPLVQQHHARVPRLYLGGGVVVEGVADQDQSGDTHPEERPQIVHLALGDVVGVPDEDHLAALGGRLFDRVRHLAEERLTGVRDDQAYQLGAARRHGLGDPVGPVPQLLDRGEDTLARGRGDRPGSVVDDVADDGGGSSRQSRHVIPSHLGHARSLRGWTAPGQGVRGLVCTRARCPPCAEEGMGRCTMPRP
jgi:hypothetical protein